MNSYNSQATKGFRTFILTLSVSLIIFSVVYYLMSDSQTVTDNTMQASTETLSAEDKEEDTVFGKIAATTPDVTSRAVLAGTNTAPTTTGTTTSPTTTTKQSTMAPVPNGGVTQLTWGFMISLVSFALGFLVISKNPRSLAMNFFEKKMLNDE